MSTGRSDDEESMHSADDTEFAGFPDISVVVPPNQECRLKPEGLANDLKVMIRLREQMKQRVISVQRSLMAQGQRSLGELVVMKDMLASAYQEYNGCHNEVMTRIPDRDVPVEAVVYQAFEELYFEVSTAVEERLILAKNRESSPANATPHIIVQQQPLKAPIPTFDGSYGSWPKFKAIFQDLMANSRDSDAMKLYHLDKALVGEAAGLLDAKILNEGNYEQAWTILTDRFENLRVTVESHFRALLSLKKMTSESHKELRCLLNEVTRNVESLRYLKQEVSGLSEHMLVFLITNALDPSTRKAWESKQKKGELPRYEPTIAYLTSRAQILENCEMVFGNQCSPGPRNKPAQRCHAISTKKPASDIACDFCDGSHANFLCSALTSLSTSQRRVKVRLAGLCFNCLQRGHFASECPSTDTCRICEARHNTLLHDGAAPSDPQVSASCSSRFASTSKTVLLQTAVVDVIDEHGNPHPCRVLLDSGSQVNFVTEEFASRLGIKRKRTNVPITGINELRSRAHHKVTVRFRSRTSSFASSLDCLVTPKVTGVIPSRKIDVNGWRLPQEVPLADPAFHIPNQIDMMIGGELFFNILKPRYKRLAKNLPHLRETHLGWIVAGVLKEPYVTTAKPPHLSNLVTVEQQLRHPKKMPNIPKRLREETGKPELGQLAHTSTSSKNAPDAVNRKRWVANYKAFPVQTGLIPMLSGLNGGRMFQSAPAARPVPTTPMSNGCHCQPALSTERREVSRPAK